MNALALTVNSGVRAFAPVLGTSLFATGVKWGWAHGHLAWIILVILSVLFIIPMYYLPEAAEGKVKKPSQSE